MKLFSKQYLDAIGPFSYASSHNYYSLLSLVCCLCRPEEFLEHVGAVSRGSGATQQQSTTVTSSRAEASTPDSDSDSELFVNTNRPPVQAQSDHSSESDSS